MADPNKTSCLNDASMADKRDAERYRWLREQVVIDGKAMVHIQPPYRTWGAFGTPANGETLDAAIDAALSVDKEGGKG